MSGDNKQSISGSDRKGRRGTRRMLVQALYQHQMTGHSGDELIAQYSATTEFRRVNRDYFEALLDKVLSDTEALDALLSDFADRPADQLDPIERAILWVGVTELQHYADVPASVVINEAIELCKTFGAEDGHRFVNAVLDKAATALQKQSG